MKKRVTEIGVMNAIKKSEGAIDIFTSTVAKLEQANAELESARDKDLEQIELINQNIILANVQEARNFTLLTKINAIIGGK